MAVIARIVGVSLLLGALGAGLGIALAGRSSDANGVAAFFAAVAGIIGAIAGAAREIVAARHRKPDW